MGDLTSNKKIRDALTGHPFFFNKKAGRMEHLLHSRQEQMLLATREEKELTFNPNFVKVFTNQNIEK